MRLSAIRLRDVGPFRGGLAIEGLSGGLDVLIAPNEAGKSTIFRAVETVFFAKHSGTGANVQSMASDAGGSAILEAEFEAADRHWRITKSFGRKKSARLESLDASAARDAWTGAEAETRLAQLIGLADRDGTGKHGAHGFLWVGQRGAIDDTKLSPEIAARTALKDIVEREVAALSGTKRLQQVRDSVAGELLTLVTASKSQPRGPWLDAIRRRDEAACKLAAARAAQDVAIKRASRIAALTQQRAVLSASASKQATGQTERVAGAGIEDARAARTLADAAVQAAEDAVRRHAQSVTARRAAEEALREADALVTVAADITRLQAELSAAEAELASRRQAHDAVRNRIAALSAEQSRLEAADIEQRYRLLDRRLNDARAVSSAIEQLTGELAANAATPTRIAALHEANRRRERAEDALAAALPRVSIAYDPGGDGRILRDGNALADGDVAMAAGDGMWPLRLDIPGIGCIVVDLPAASNRGELEVVRRRACDDISAALASMEVDTVEGADTAAKRRVECERQLADGRARLAGLAPDGIAQLAADLECIARRVVQRPATAGVASAAEVFVPRTRVKAIGPDLFSHADSARGDLADARADTGQAVSEAGGAIKFSPELADVRAKLAAASLDSERLRSATDDARVAVARLTATIEAARARFTAEAATQDPANRDAFDIGLDVERLKAHAALRAATLQDRVREEVAFRETVPSAQVVAALIAAREACVATVAAREREQQDIDLELQRLLGIQEGAGAEITAGDIERLETDLAGAETSVATYETEAGGLELLRSLLDEAIVSAQDRLIEPITRRLDPYLAAVFPDAALELGGDLSVTGLARDGQRVAPAHLSGGTAEQIAILARLAYGRVLSENGQSTPVILDDALVYTDDVRLVAMFDCLSRAARHHQVLVLSCQESRFAALPGTRLRLTPWGGPEA